MDGDTDYGVVNGEVRRERKPRTSRRSLFFMDFYWNYVPSRDNSESSDRGSIGCTYCSC